MGRLRKLSYANTILPDQKRTNGEKYENSMIRMYVGLEDTSDLIKDIELSLKLLSV